MSSPVLFNLAIDYAMELPYMATFGVTLDDMFVTDLYYADDICL